MAPPVWAYYSRPELLMVEKEAASIETVVKEGFTKQGFGMLS